MPKTMEEYLPVVGTKPVYDLYQKAAKLYAKHVVHINSTFIGGGVAEILSSLVPLMNNTGLEAGWRVLHGTPGFYEVTKRFHNAMQSAPLEFTEQDFELYLEVNEQFATYTHLTHDCIFVHDPQPLPLIRFFHKQQPWIWRCHIDLSEPNPQLWDFLKKYMLRYDLVLVSSEQYKKDDLPVKQKIVHPAIDPLTPKNIQLSEQEINQLLKDANIPRDKPIITQVSRMDKWKDPEGLLEVYQLVRKKMDCRMLFCYNLASDDPEGMDIYSRIHEKANEIAPPGDVLFVMGNNDRLVNAIQSASDVVVQKSTKEGFCLTVTEAMWKGKPVIGSTAGGIPIQIKDGKNGFLLDALDYQGFADRIIEVLKSPKLAQKLGTNAKETVRDKFLITRLLDDYLSIMGDYCG